jgi:hypothetical protein
MRPPTFRRDQNAILAESELIGIRPSSPTSWPKVTALLEAATGFALLLSPHMPVSLLLGSRSTRLAG